MYVELAYNDPDQEKLFSFVAESDLVDPSFTGGFKRVYIFFSISCGIMQRLNLTFAFMAWRLDGFTEATVPGFLYIPD